MAYQPHRISRNRDPQDIKYVRAVVAAIGQCQVHVGGWRRKDVLRGRANPLAGVFALFREMKAFGAPLAQLEGANMQLYDAVRGLITEGMAPIANETLAEAIRKEQEIEAAENIDSIDVLAHLTAGNLRKLRASMLAECEAQRHVVEVIDAELLRIEGRH